MPVVIFDDIRHWWNSVRRHARSAGIKISAEPTAEFIDLRKSTRIPPLMFFMKHIENTWKEDP